MTAYLWVGLGSALGGMARFAVTNLVLHRFSASVPLGTLIVNVTGSFAIGFLAAFTGGDLKWTLPFAWRQFLMVGFLGGYTTFSSFSLQTFSQFQEGKWGAAAANILLSVVLCLAGVALGYGAGQWIHGKN